MVIRLPDEVAKLLEHEVIGRSITTFEVFGVNSLKTVVPPPSSLAGDAVRAMTHDAEGHLELILERTRLDVDLARTGGLEIGVADAAGVRPTGRISFADGGCLDFKEPARTKRITFALWPT